MFPFADSQKSSRVPLFTLLLIFLNVAVFLVELTVPDIDVFFSKYAFTPANFILANPATWWPMITAAFLHGGISHVFFNMLFLWVFGDNVEDELGSVGYLLFYLGATISAALLQYLVDPTTTIPMLGASGAIAGILGFYLIVFPHHSIKTLLVFAGGIFVRELPAQIFLAYWAITQLFNGFGSLAIGVEDGTAWFAHIGGFLFGLVIGYLVRNTRQRYHGYEIVS